MGDLGRKESSTCVQLTGADETDKQDVLLDPAGRGRALVQPGQVPVDYWVSLAQAFEDGGDPDMSIGAGFPAEYDIAPPASTIWYVKSIGMYLSRSGNMSDSKFGNGSVLATGVILSGQFNSVAYSDLVILQRNPDLAVVFNQAGYGGTNSFFMGTYMLPTPIKLDGDQSDFLRWTVNESTSGATYMNSTAHILRFGSAT